MRQSPIPWAYRVFFRQVGIDPDAQRTPVEAAALERLLRGRYESQNLLDDALTIALVETGVPIWAVDADRVELPLTVRAAGGGRAARARRGGAGAAVRAPGGRGRGHAGRGALRRPGARARRQRANGADDAVLPPGRGRARHPRRGGLLDLPGSARSGVNRVVGCRAGGVFDDRVARAGPARRAALSRHRRGRRGGRPADAARPDRPAGARTGRGGRLRLAAGGPALDPAGDGRSPAALAGRARDPARRAGGARRHRPRGARRARRARGPRAAPARSHAGRSPGPQVGARHQCQLGQPGCTTYEVRPQLGVLGMVLGWWRVKISSGCPLPGGPRLGPRPR